jgi:hypothetical protein
MKGGLETCNDERQYDFSLPIIRYTPDTNYFETQRTTLLKHSSEETYENLRVNYFEKDC